MTVSTFTFSMKILRYREDKPSFNEGTFPLVKSKKPWFTFLSKRPTMVCAHSVALTFVPKFSSMWGDQNMEIYANRNCTLFSLFVPSRIKSSSPFHCFISDTSASYFKSAPKWCAQFCLRKKSNPATKIRLDREIVYHDDGYPSGNFAAIRIWRSSRLNSFFLLFFFFQFQHDKYLRTRLAMWQEIVRPWSPSGHGHEK